MLSLLTVQSSSSYITCTASPRLWRTSIIHNCLHFFGLTDYVRVIITLTFRKDIFSMFGDFYLNSHHSVTCGLPKIAMGMLHEVISMACLMSFLWHIIQHRTEGNKNIQDQYYTILFPFYFYVVIFFLRLLGSVFRRGHVLNNLLNYSLLCNTD